MFPITAIRTQTFPQECFLNSLTVALSASVCWQLPTISYIFLLVFLTNYKPDTQVYIYIHIFFQRSHTHMMILGIDVSTTREVSSVHHSIASKFQLWLRAPKRQTLSSYGCMLCTGHHSWHLWIESTWMKYQWRPQLQKMKKFRRTPHLFLFQRLLLDKLLKIWKRLAPNLLNFGMPSSEAIWRQFPNRCWEKTWKKWFLTRKNFRYASPTKGLAPLPSTQ